jgi:ATP-dependent Lhr-like helicase
VIAAEDAGRYRDALGALPEPGLPAVFLEPVPDALHGIVRRYARTHGPFTAEDAAGRLGVPERRVLDELERLAADGTVVQGGMRPGGSGTEWCDSEVLRRIRRATLAVLRSEIEAVPGEALARFLPRWQRIDEGGGGAGERLRDTIATLQGLVLPVAILETDVLPRRVPGFRPEQLDALSTSGEIVWAGAGEGRVALYIREDAPLLGPPPHGVPAEGDAVERVRARLAQAPCFLDELAAKYAGGVRIATLNVDENPVTASRYDVHNIPTMLLFKDGNLVNRLEGALPKETIEQHLIAIMKIN